MLQPGTCWSSTLQDTLQPLSKFSVPLIVCNPGHKTCKMLFPDIQGLLFPSIQGLKSESKKQETTKKADFLFGHENLSGLTFYPVCHQYPWHQFFLAVIS